MVVINLTEMEYGQGLRKESSRNLFRPDSEVYNGQWNNGVKQGYGRYDYSTSGEDEYYLGMWQGDKRHDTRPPIIPNGGLGRMKWY